MNFLKWLIRFLFAGVLLRAVYGLYMWQATFWPTDIYGRPIQYWQQLSTGISQHPEWLAPNNWGNQYSGSLAWVAFCLLVCGYAIQHSSWWKRRHWPDLVDVPWQYVAGVLPILLLCMAVVGVGANRAGFGYEQQIPIVIAGNNAFIYQSFRPMNGTVYSLEISNYPYHGVAHKSSAFVITAMIVPWNMSGMAGVDKNGKPRLSMRKEWLLLLCIMLILFAYWETTENQAMYVQGGPRLGAENPRDDSEWDMFNMVEGVVLCFAFYNVTWMMANPDGWPPKEISNYHARLAQRQNLPSE